MEFEEPKELTEAMKQGLARMYADPGARAYLQNAIAIANRNAMVMLETGKFTEAQAYAARIRSLRQLLEKGKNFFTHFEKVAQELKKPLRDATNSKG